MSEHLSSNQQCAHESVKTLTTDAGMVYACERCSRHWFRTYEQAAGMSGAEERTPPSGSKQSYDDRLREVSRATVDAKMLGCGFLMLLPDGTYQYVAPEDIYLKPKRTADETTAKAINADAMPDVYRDHCPLCGSKPCACKSLAEASDYLRGNK